MTATRPSTDADRPIDVPEVSRTRALSAYVVIALASVGSFYFIRSLGIDLVANEVASEGSSGFRTEAKENTLLGVLIALTLIVALSRVLGRIVKRFSQPAVIGEIIAGIVLGPSLLGSISPTSQAALFPSHVVSYLGILSQVGVILYMFMVGIDLDTSHLRQRTRTMFAVSHASIAAPFILGAGLALFLYPRYATADVPFVVYALFLGAAMSVTAFPVLARILADRGMQHSPIGVLALSAAAVDDVSAWILLAFVVGVANPSATSAVTTAGLSLVYLAVMLMVVRPLVLRVAKKHEGDGSGGLAIVVLGILVSALLTELIGIHALFGAFLFGAIIPHDSRLARDLTQKLEVVLVLFLPAFFALTGLKTELGLLATSAHWVACGLVIVLACVGKIGGSWAAARYFGLGSRDAWSLGVLMNTRGLMGLVVLNVGLELRVISTTVFTMMVLMALVTTFMPSPLLSRLRPSTAT